MMPEKLSSITPFDKIKHLSNLYKNYLVKNEQIKQQHAKSNNAGNELYDTLTENFEKLFAKVDNLDASDKVLDEFLSIINEDCLADVLLEMFRNLHDKFNPKIIERLKVIEKRKEESDPEETASSSCLSSASNSEGEYAQSQPVRNCRRSSRLENKKNKYIKNSERRKRRSYNLDKESDFSDSDDEETKGYDSVSIQKVILDPVVQEKLEAFIEKDFNAISNRSLDTKKVSDKVKEISSYLGISQRVIGPIVAKLSIGAFNDLMSRIKDWDKLKERMQDVFRRLYAWIINKEAILFVHSLCPKKIQFYGNGKLIIPKPSYFWLNCDEAPTDEIERCITPPVIKFDNIDEDVSTFGEFKPNLRVNKYIRTIESNPKYEEIFERTGKTYEFQNKNIVVENIKYMTTKNFKFKGCLNTVDICKEIRRHLTETNCSQRNFAENILGMSQGSASDLLTKPKEWHGLTRRGREPYIKMKAYLDTYEKLKEDLKAIFEEEEKEHLEKLKSFHKKKLEKSGKKFDEKSLYNVLNKYSKPSKSLTNSNENENISPSLNKVKQNDELIIKQNEVSFQPKENCKIMTKVTNQIKSCPNQIVSDEAIISNLISPTIESLNTMSIATEMKTLLEECKITPAIFAENFMKIKPQEFHRILTAPRAWNLSSLDDRNAYRKMKSFLDNEELVKSFKENGFNALPKLLKNFDGSILSLDKDKKVVRYMKSSKPFETTPSICNSKILKFCVKKRPTMHIEEDVPAKKVKLCNEESQEKIKNVENNQLKLCEEVLEEDANSIQLTDKKNSTQKTYIVPFTKPLPLISNQHSKINCIEKNLTIKEENIDEIEVENGNDIPITSIQIKDEVIKPDSDTIDTITLSDDSFNINDTLLSKKTKDPEFFKQIHENSFKPIHKKNVNLYNIETCHAKIIKSNNKEELLIDTAELEILYLAWTYNPNPQSVMKNYLSQMTVLPVETIDTWYHTFNKLKGNYLRTADNSLTYRENLRKSVLSTTTRKKYLAITDLVFKQLFSNKLAELMNQNQ
ncbi:Homeobox protein cut [Strongyloides ratti]|uniref:Homeobox protein cut n=1 Tax=Strongyloides ratti TaxID=34506 RepID=A0A090LNQ5_STRRB|nr:Homeobox protein cut [Strongyloides ratti]CEF71391.1 Homeobox protein cut [Strongyloides ratti]